MLFNSLPFLWFFLAVTAGYCLLPQKLRWAWLLVASAGFYAAFVPAYLLILFGIVLVDYAAGIWIEKTEGAARKWALVASITANVGTLAAFKYGAWLHEIATDIWARGGMELPPWPLVGWLLPLGLSFHTFQGLSYTLEVYHRRQPAERHLGLYALYVFFYPQLVAGPIERPQHLLPQLRAAPGWNNRNVLNGLHLILWGLFKKVALADRLSPIVAESFGPNTDAYGAPVVLSTLAFGLQIYGDFSGYTDIALGAAQVMGIRLVENFRGPYFATSISDFWRRWHISLSTWFRDYVYKPLGGSRVGAARVWVNILITFLLSGLWHGAGSHYAVWGLWHGAFVGAEKAIQKTQLAPFVPSFLRGTQLARAFGWAYTIVVVSLGWVLFRAENLKDAWHLARSFRLDFWATATDPSLMRMGLLRVEWYLLAAAVVLWLGVEIAQSQGRLRPRLAQHPWVERGLASGLLAAILLLGQFDAKGVFIYFQF